MVQTLESEGRTAGKNFPVIPRFRVEQLCSFSYQEKETGFVFSGKAYPVLEFIYVHQGTIHSVADGRDLLLGQGDMVLYAPNQWHMLYADIGVSPKLLTVTFTASGEALSSLFGKAIRAPQNITVLLQQMLREQETPDCHSDDMSMLLLNQILLLLLRSSDIMERESECANPLNKENLIIERAQQFICEHVRERLSVPIVARNTDISPSYLTALFHKHLQISPGEYIRRVKLQESKQMIREGSLNFTQIAEALQYSTVHHFSRQFKEIFGITPTEYAKSDR